MPNNLKKIGKVWYSDYSVITDGKRKRINRALSTDKEVAQIKIAELIKVRRAERHGHVPQDISWDLFKQRYLEYSKSKHPTTHSRDKLAIRYLEEHASFEKLSDFTPMVLESLKAHLKAIGKGDWNINRTLTALKALMHKAEEWNFIAPQRWKSVKPFKTPRGRLLFWTLPEAEELFSQCSGPWAIMARLSVWAGLRREEMHTLPWKNVDLERNRIHIVGTGDWSPKNDLRRWVPMKPELRAYLENLPRNSAYVLGDDRPALGVISTYFSRIVARAGLKGSLHTGRHTYGSWLAMAGVPLAVIQQRMGHTSIKVTEIYAHLCPESMADKWQA